MMRKIGCFIWGAATMACWFLSFSHLGFAVETPNCFLMPAILSTIIAIGLLVVLALDE